MKKSLALIAVLAALVACSKTDETPAEAKKESAVTTAPANHEADVLSWRKNRIERLTSDDSWLTLVGLFWLEEGANAIGSDKAANNILLPEGAPAKAGTLTLADGKVTFVPAIPVTLRAETPIEAPAGKPLALRDDTDPAGPTVVGLDTLSFQIVKRNERFGVRMKDPQSEARRRFAGLDYFPVDPRWRVEARFEPYDPPKRIPITNVIGMTSDETSPGALVFEVDGKTYRLDPILEAGSTNLFIIFKDATSRDATYEAGRYLYASPAGADGKVILDFNRAYNPPCAFTEFATCPLPPLQNRLPFRIEAGEKKYAKAH